MTTTDSDWPLCPERFNDRETHFCVRPLGHVGDHQASDGTFWGNSSSRRDPATTKPVILPDPPSPVVTIEGLADMTRALDGLLASALSNKWLSDTNRGDFLTAVARIAETISDLLAEMKAGDE